MKSIRSMHRIAAITKHYYFRRSWAKINDLCSGYCTGFSAATQITTRGMSLSITINRLVPSGMLLHLVMVLAMAQTSLSYGATSASESGRMDTVAPPLLNWRNLELQDSGVAGSVTTRIDLRKLSAAEVRPTLVDGPNPMSQRVTGTRIQELVVDNSIRLLLGAGIKTRDRLWLNEDDGLPLQLIRMQLGSKPSQKLYRFGSNRVYRLRRQPANRVETEQPPEQWSQVSESFYPLPDPGGECPTILESSQLLYLLSNPEHGISESPETLCVFSRKHVYQVEFQIVGREQLDVDYLQVVAGQENRVRETLEAVRVVLNSRPFNGAAGDVESFSFLGLKDEIHLLLSDPGRIPLQVRGQVPGFGMIDLELKKLTR